MGQLPSTSLADSYISGNPFVVTTQKPPTFLISLGTSAKATGDILTALLLASPPPSYDTLKAQLDLIAADTRIFLKKIEEPPCSHHKAAEGQDVLAVIYTSFENPAVYVFNVPNLTPQQTQTLVMGVQSIRDMLVHAALSFQKQKVDTTSLLGC